MLHKEKYFCGRYFEIFLNYIIALLAAKFCPRNLSNKVFQVKEKEGTVGGQSD